MPDYPPLHELRRLLGAEPRPRGHDTIRCIRTDTRQLEPGALYVALRGERFDGHAFVVQALRRGAVAAIVARRWRTSDVPETQLVRVDSPLGAYHALGCWWRELVARPVVAVTGSVGKTTTKELIASALSSLGPVLSTPGNFNNEFGVPQTLLQLRPHHRAAVIEMGMRGTGQIGELGRAAMPDVGVITNVGTAHIGLLGSRQAIARAKCELLQTLSPQGVAVLNAEDPLLLETAAAVWRGRTVTFGLERGDVRGSWLDDGRLRVDGETIALPLPGAHNARNLLAALAVARELGVPLRTLRALQVTLPPGRARRLQLGGGITVLDETYNAGLESTLAALQLLARHPAKRRLAVLGTMKELGDHSVALHRQVGEAVAAEALDGLYLLADPDQAAALADGARGVPTRSFSSHAELLDQLRRTLTTGDCVLFKASRAVALDQVVAALVDEKGVTSQP